MKSKWHKHKSKAIEMRGAGFSIREIESKLKIPKSTLSGWFKDVKLDKEQKSVLHNKWMKGLEKARVGAVTWHNKQKEQRIQRAHDEAEATLNKIDSDNEVIELALSMLYLGEGFKKKLETGIGNSDPMILLFFVTILKNVYKVNICDITCHLHLRADQNPDEMKKYWSEILRIPETNFGKTSIDMRTAGTKTYDSYKGVCVVRCGNVAIQRKLIYLSKMYCDKIIESMGG